MQKRTCSACTGAFAASSMFVVNGSTLCEPCADVKVAEIQASKGKLEVQRITDPTVCFKCNADYGSQELPPLSGLHVCESCRQILLNFQFPTWLKSAFAGLLALLVIALIHGAPYFSAGHAYYKGKRLLDEGHATEAAPFLREAVKVAPKSSDVVGTTAIALLRTGDIDEANRIVKDVSFDSGDFYESVRGEFTRWDQTAKQLEAISRFGDEKKYAEALNVARLIQSGYPEIPQFKQMTARLEYVSLSASKDYRTLLEVSEKNWNELKNYETTSALAGAYALMYAQYGNEDHRAKAVEFMSQSKALAKATDEQEDLKEWEPRFLHRIETREIIDKTAYDARFRPAQKPEGGR